MTLLSYEIFQTIIEQGSFAKAAQLLHLTPSAVSHSISSMEEEIGFPLFIRNKNGVQLTSAGEQISPYLQKIVQANTSLLQTVAQMKGLQTGTVKIGCVNSVCIAWMPAIIESFSELHPQIELDVYQGSYTDVVAWVRNGVIDIGIVSDAVDDGLPFIPLFHDPLVCVTPKGYFPKKTKTITPADLKNQPFVIQQDSCDVDVINYLTDYKLDVRAHCHILDDQSALAMVECGAGISIMPEMIIKNIVRKVDIFPLNPEQHRTLGILSLNPDFLSPASAVMVAHIKNMLKEGKI
ncbi:LysR family transcriptional regulator [Lachnospiraceae bacterium YH-ros2228]|nr:LysR family transcriptional regulator [Lachnospiraceae bacterium]MDD6450327.1 LysR family transcriptional regulator [Lachnospiraceae bacterium]